MSSLHARSPAQLSSRGPALGFPREGIHLSQWRHFITCFSSQHLQETQLPPMTATNPQELGFLLPLFRCAQSRHLYVSVIEMEGRCEVFRCKYLVTIECARCSKVHVGSFKL